MRLKPRRSMLEETRRKPARIQIKLTYGRLKIYMYIYVAGKLVAYMIKWFYIRGRLDVIFIYMPIKVFVRPLSSPDQYHHRPITSPQKESPEDLEAQYLEISNGSDTAISRSCFSWDLMLKIHRQFLHGISATQADILQATKVKSPSTTRLLYVHILKERIKHAWKAALRGVRYLVWLAGWLKHLIVCI